MYIELQWQTSLHFGEQDIFHELLRRKPDFLDKFTISLQEIRYLKAIKGNLKAFYAQVDAIINQKGIEILKQLPIQGADQVVREFVDLMAIGLAGLFHYIGLLFNVLYQQQKYLPQIPSVFIGGNGSQIFRWVSILQDLLRKIALQITYLRIFWLRQQASILKKDMIFT